jgi:hypothetical protein
VAHVAKHAGEHVRAFEESGQPVPRPRQRRGFGLSPPPNAHRPTLRSYGTRDMCCYRPSQHDAATKYLASLV